MRTDEYLTALTEQIRCKKARDGVTKEIRSHIEDQQAYYESEGLEASEAELLAVKEMGSPVETGIELDRIHRPKMAWGIIALIGIISIAGYVAQYMLQMNFEQADFLPYNGLRYIFHLIIGFSLMTAICFFDYSQIRYWAKEITVVLFLVLILQVSLFGITYNGLRTWVRVGRITLDVRQILFLSVPLYGAILYSYRGEGYGVLVKATAWMLPAVVIALRCPSITTAVMLVTAFVVTLSVAVWMDWFHISRIKTLTAIWSGMFLLPVIGSLVILRFGAAYQAARIKAMVDASDEGGGYLLRTIRGLLAGSQMIGSNEMPIERMLPSSSDYVLTYIISHYGILAAVLLVGLMAGLFLCLLKVSLKQKNQLGMLMGVGCTTALLVQLLLYILGNTGVLLVSNYCPFLNYGGSGMLMTYILLGLLLSICRYENVISDVTLSAKRKRGFRIRLIIEK